MTPVWSSARKIDVSKELRAAFAGIDRVVPDVPLQPNAPVDVPTLSPGPDKPSVLTFILSHRRHQGGFFVSGRSVMGELSKKLRSLEGGRVAFWCPGCKAAHQITVEDTPNRQGPIWGYNGYPDAQTFTPSILVRGTLPSDVPEEFDDPTKDRPFVCHSFVTDGRIQFPGDCTHALAGQTTGLPNFPSSSR